MNSLSKAMMRMPTNQLMQTNVDFASTADQ